MELHWALAFRAVATGPTWAFLPLTIMPTLISFALLYLQSFLDEVFNPRLRRARRRTSPGQPPELAEAARKLAAQIEGREEVTA